MTEISCPTRANDLTNDAPLPDKRCGNCSRWFPSGHGMSQLGLCPVRLASGYTSAQMACDVADLAGRARWQPLNGVA